MLSMEFIAEIRRHHFVSGESISLIALSLKLSRPTVRKALKTRVEPVYQRQHQPCPKLGEFQAQLEPWLDLESRLPKRQRRTAQRLFEGLKAEGYRSSYDPVQRFVKRWQAQRASGPAVTQAFVPLAFPPKPLVPIDAVILDELGHLPFPDSGGALLFHLISPSTGNYSTLIPGNFWTLIDSLTAVVRHITGTHWSGPLFFGLGGKRGAQ